MFSYLNLVFLTPLKDSSDSQFKNESKYFDGGIPRRIEIGK